MIDRPHVVSRVQELFRAHPCVAILGPRQCGKTTLARILSAKEPVVTFFDLESPLDIRKLSVPMRTLSGLTGLVVIDEIQRMPGLFETLRRFWTMIAHYHGQVWNAAEFARSLGTSEGTARRYLDILAGAYVIRVLSPWFENLSKRQVKAPKIYVRDSGLFHSLLGLRSREDLLGHPKLGASWEGFALEQILAAFRVRDAYFWATHGGAELDLMLMIRGKRYGFEFKVSDAPGSTRSARIALADLGLEHLWILYPGADEYELDEQLSVLPLRELPALAGRLTG